MMWTNFETKRKEKMKTLRNCTLVLLVFSIGMSLWAQDDNKVTVTITTNVRNASVAIQGGALGSAQGQAPATFQLKPGRYSIRIQAGGYEPYSGTLNVTSSSKQSYNFTLQLGRVSVEINSNVSGAAIFINDKEAGTTPTKIDLPSGRYTLKLTANGYITIETQLRVSKAANQEYTFTLEPAEVPLSINTNVKGATIYINNNPMGVTPTTIMLLPGQYTLRLVKDEYQPFQTTLSVSTAANQQYTFALIPSTATVNFIVAQKLLNRRIKNPTSLIQLFVDDELVNPEGELIGIKIPVGRRTIELASGGLAVKGVFNIQPGVVYQVDLVMLLELIQ